MFGRVAGAAGRERLAKLEEARASASRTGTGIGSPESTGTPRASLAARYFGGSDSRGSLPSSAPASRDDNAQQALLEVDGRRQVGTRGAEVVPSPRGGVAHLIGRRLADGDEGHMLAAQQVKLLPGEKMTRPWDQYSNRVLV